MTLLQLIEDGARRFEAAGLAFGHGTHNAFDEAAWLALWALGLPLDTPLETWSDPQNNQANQPLAACRALGVDSEKPPQRCISLRLLAP